MFAESLITRIAIVDERLQDFAVNSDYGKDVKFPFIEVFNFMKIYFPPKKRKEKSRDIPVPRIDLEDINLLSKDFNKQVISGGASIRESIKTWIKEQSCKMDYILIHLGILEKVFDTTDAIDLKSCFDELKKACDKNVKFIIISGRGKPHNLPTGERFLNYSQVAQYVSDNQSKYMLTDLCLSSRKTKNS